MNIPGVPKDVALLSDSLENIFVKFKQNSLSHLIRKTKVQLKFWCVIC